MEPEYVRPLETAALARRLRAVFTACIVAWLALVATPGVPGPIRPGLDPGWMTGLHLAASQGLVAGRDLVWTYGPLGWLALPVATEEHLATMLAFRLILWAIWVSALAVLAVRSLPVALAAIAAAAASVVANGAFAYFLADGQLGLAVMALGLLALSEAGPGRNPKRRASEPLPPPGESEPRAGGRGLRDRGILSQALPTAAAQWPMNVRYCCLALLAVLAGVATAVKFNVAVEAVAVLGGTSAIAAWEDRRLGRTALAKLCAIGLAFAASSFTCYTAATGAPEFFPAYLAHAIEIGAGYSEGMSFPGPGLLVWLALAAAAVVLVAIPLASKSKGSLLRGWIPAAAGIFLAFKHGVIRGDIHMLPVLLNTSLATAYLGTAATRVSDRNRLISVQALMTALGLWMVLGVAPGGVQHLTDRLTLKPAAAIAGAVFEHSGAQARLADANAKSKQRIIEFSPPSTLALDKTAEVIPYETSIVWANNWQWNPRPVFQTYQVCTAAHDRLNAEHLASARAADLIFFHWDPIDQRHPLFVDPLSWRETLNRYEFMARDGRFLALERRARPRFGPPRQFMTTSAVWGKKVIVPSSNAPLLLAADIPRTFLGDAANLFYRVNPVWIEISDEQQVVTRWRFLRQNITHGVLINPFPANLDELARLTGPDFSVNRRAVSVRFLADTPGQFAPSFSIRWLLMNLPGSHTVSAGAEPVE